MSCTKPFITSPLSLSCPNRVPRGSSMPFRTGTLFSGGLTSRLPAEHRVAAFLQFLSLLAYVVGDLAGCDAGLRHLVSHGFGRLLLHLPRQPVRRDCHRQP